MKKKGFSTLIILLAALGLAIYVIYDDQKELRTNEDPNAQKLEEYLAKEGLEQVSSIQPGDIAIDVTMPLYDSHKKKSISDFQGEFLIMNMWASWCPPCREEMPDIIQFHEDFQEENVQVVGINLTTQETNKERISNFIEDFQIPFPVLLDEDGEVSKEYEIIAVPMTFILDPDGRIAVKHQGFLNYDILVGLFEDAKETYYKEELKANKRD